jgi:hypothetical protein
MPQATLAIRELHRRLGAAGDALITPSTDCDRATEDSIEDLMKTYSESQMRGLALLGFGLLAGLTAIEKAAKPPPKGSRL